MNKAKTPIGIKVVVLEIITTLGLLTLGGITKNGYLLGAGAISIIPLIITAIQLSEGDL